MVLTVTINPLLENRLYFDKVVFGQSNRGGTQEYKAGGKGINVSRQLNYLNIKNLAHLFLGGNNGKILRRILSEEKIDFTHISTKSETRAAALSIEKDEERITTLFDPNSTILEKEVSEYKSKLEKVIRNCTIIVFSGSSPGESTDEIFPFGIELANKLGKISILDSYGPHLKKCIAASPTILHNNIIELESSLNINLSTEKSKIEFLNDLYINGIKMAFITEGAKPSYASQFDFIYKIENPKVDEIDPTGSGDAFVAGLVYGLEKSLIFNDFSRVASALGAVNASKYDVCTSTLDEVKKLIELVKVSPIGKKIKIIDDSPSI